jgi:hypothetical protein
MSVAPPEIKSQSTCAWGVPESGNAQNPVPSSKSKVEAFKFNRYSNIMAPLDA